MTIWVGIGIALMVLGVYSSVWVTFLGAGVIGSTPVLLHAARGARAEVRAPKPRRDAVRRPAPRSQPAAAAATPAPAPRPRRDGYSNETSNAVGVELRRARRDGLRLPARRPGRQVVARVVAAVAGRPARRRPCRPAPPPSRRASPRGGGATAPPTARAAHGCGASSPRAAPGRRGGRPPCPDAAEKLNVCTG